MDKSMTDKMGEILKCSKHDVTGHLNLICECIEDRVAKLQDELEVHRHLAFDASVRITTLQGENERLRNWIKRAASHGWDCAKRGMEYGSQHYMTKKPCSCGLDELLGENETPPPSP